MQRRIVNYYRIWPLHRTHPETISIKLFKIDIYFKTTIWMISSSGPHKMMLAIEQQWGVRVCVCVLPAGHQASRYHRWSDFPGWSRRTSVSGHWLTPPGQSRHGTRWEPGCRRGTRWSHSPTENREQDTWHLACSKPHLSSHWCWTMCSYKIESVLKLK